ncbi:UDP-N-acetylglucosamine--N-acetylmuramyl-(pentapeptide) pyrophosphoryl-undecaprenol N-acetylglucosamine transferase [Henriciella pelagia]|jgi:UDP-N-acetylglucosamine--N-acetylmuramyl-(pentapeptide) pyrophosphoryl-undecaprenol N-acetylglucosamine transferase|uniref:UDP-N-acetylglucosamine--N-acetylmuramyl-(pentapeptide) pyrophosphoryl-undecaprenol N-acetylglucosamine transferase n=1 Tax=Henriciella pelagia TaxID=1977912 RepID=A0ABQ1JDZ2_9PROT|nr:UDP-N-acetylglucosamine--N-acetylmuramyl-(pentapeptide) pyrophosphoryl-undecaprenol N-acetylglucosamine transferase [Henriciella pelagia]GGB65959.1 UDP-N-acetylglucosamine--N-acetylmuramyl-(pentapeptide) pyrophosphoryl-undecaprenol N-acetylglucosamine transferase [Henriciella pelagia]
MAEPDAAKPLVIIGAGGTGGHMFPAAAFAEEMRSRGWQVGLMSDERGLRYAEHFPADWKEEVKAASPNTRKPWTLPGAALKIWGGINSAASTMKRLKPSLVAGFGGYPAFPALSAAARRKVPILIHEQNAVLGRVNRRFAGKAAIVASGFDRLDRLPTGAVHHAVGNPVRAPIAAMRDKPFPPMDGGLTIFITGGSQGAKILGDIIPLAIANHLPATLRARLKVVQQVREEQLEQVRAVYDKVQLQHELKPFFSDMPERLAAAHLIIARSGAGTVSEIAAVGRPSILIPLKIAMDDHQTANAEALVDAGAADVLLEDNLYPNLLGELIKVRIEDATDLKNRAALARVTGTITAASDLADLAEQVAKQPA